MLKNTFKIIFMMISLLALINSEGYCQQGKVIRITDHNDIINFALHTSPGISQIWKMDIFDRKVFEESIINYKNKMMKTLIDKPDTYVESGLNFVVKHLSEYNIEYAGIIADGKKLLICQLLFSKREDMENGEAESFSYILDGGFSVVTILYDPDSRTVISLNWHGEA